MEALVLLLLPFALDAVKGETAAVIFSSITAQQWVTIGFDLLNLDPALSANIQAKLKAFNIPALETFVDTQLAKLQATLEQVVGDSLADLTVERTQAINQLGDVLHGVLDRLNGATLTLSVGATSVTLKVPPKATT